MIRIVSWNIGGGLEPGAAVAVLNQIEPHIVLLSESPGRLVSRRIARDVGLRSIARAGRRRTGAKILVGDGVRRISTASRTLETSDGGVKRELAQAIVAVGGIRLSVVAAQLGLRPELRERNAQQLCEFVDGIEAPPVVGIDLNESPTGAAARMLSFRFQDAWDVAGLGSGDTYPTPTPTTRRDYVFVDPSLVVNSCLVHDKPPTDVASHHRPVVVELAAEGDGAGRNSAGRNSADESEADAA